VTEPPKDEPPKAEQPDLTNQVVTDDKKEEPQRVRKVKLRRKRKLSPIFSFEERYDAARCKRIAEYCYTPTPFDPKPLAKTPKQDVKSPAASKMEKSLLLPAITKKR
jgi:hypothetical protein